jgi:hypothetical protein
MNRLFLTLVCAVLPLATGAATAQAQRIDSPYRFVDRSHSVNLYAGWLNARSGEFALGPRPGPLVGARYDIRLGGAFDGELDVGLAPLQRMVTDTIITQGQREIVGEAPVTLLIGLAGIRFNITGPRTWHGIQPFIVMGGGVSADLAGRHELDDVVPEEVRYRYGTSFAGQFGGGAEWYVSERLSLRFDARNVLWKIRTPSAFRTSAEIAESAWTRNLGLSAGVALHF